jgi:hypothetical protein
MFPDKELKLEAREAMSYVITWASSDTPRPVSPPGSRFDALVAFAHDGIIEESCALLSQTWVV